jgi:hypothetical protein
MNARDTKAAAGAGALLWKGNVFCFFFGKERKGLGGNGGFDA